MRADKPKPPRDFRLFTVRQIARLSLKVLSAHLRELEDDREHESGTPNWWLDEVHESWRSYNAEYERRKRGLKSPKPIQEQQSVEPGGELPF